VLRLAQFAPPPKIFSGTSEASPTFVAVSSTGGVSFVVGKLMGAAAQE
jgi:hypothetical protein